MGRKGNDSSKGQGGDDLMFGRAGKDKLAGMAATTGCSVATVPTALRAEQAMMC